MTTEAIAPIATHNAKPAMRLADVRERIQNDPRASADPDIKRWLAQRWHALFLEHASRDPKALRAATRAGGNMVGLLDKRQPQQRIAERFLRGEHIAQWRHAPTPEDAAETSRTSAAGTTLLFCAGLLNGLLPDHAFRDEFAAIQEEFGWNILRADMHPMRSCADNINDIKRAMDEGIGMHIDGSRRPAHYDAPQDVVLMGYSKGGPDILAFLAKHPEYRSRVRAVVLWAAAVGGSYTADGIYENIKDVDIVSKYPKVQDALRLVSPLMPTGDNSALRRFDEYDIKGALRDLTTTQRSAFLAEHGKALDEMNIPIFTFTAATSFLRVPTFQMQDALRIARYDANNDMQLTQAQAKTGLPLETHLATLHGHHWDISYPPFPRAMRLGSPNLGHIFPRKAAMVATLSLLSDIGLMQ